MLKTPCVIAIVCILALAAPRARSAETPAPSQSAPTPTHPTKVIIDSDIGDDVDDVFSIGLALTSPEVQVLGISSAWGDTQLRVRMIDRLLQETNTTTIPVAEGIRTETKTPFSQAAYAKGGAVPHKSHPKAVDFLLDQIKKDPGNITLVAIGPLTNIGAAIDRDPMTFKKLNRVVIMGGAVRKGYGDLGYTPDRGPQPEYNIYCDVAAAQKLFTSGVPIYMMPLDSTQLKLDEDKRAFLFKQGTPLTNALSTLYYQWGQPTPTLFDAMAVAYVLDPSLCPTTPLHINIEKDGATRESVGTPNANACLVSDSDQFFRFLLPRLAKPFPLQR
jgi:inosine-uridine nucleoside N-ribohydrolase